MYNSSTIEWDHLGPSYYNYIETSKHIQKILKEDEKPEMAYEECDSTTQIARTNTYKILTMK